MKKLGVVAAIAAAFLACNHPVEKRVVQRTSNDSDVPWAGRDDTSAQARAQQRYDLAWRQLQSFRAQQALQAAQQPGTTPAPKMQLNVIEGGKDSFKGLDMNGINSAPVHLPVTGNNSGPSALRVQVYLDRNHFSVGTIDGGWGKNSAVAVWQWQRSHGIEPSGDVDDATLRSIADAAGAVAPLVSYQVTDDDLKGPFVHIPDSVYDQQRLPCMCYETVREEIAEKFHADDDFLSQLNKDVKFSELKAGDTIVVPNVRPPLTQDQPDIARISVSIAGNSFDAFDASDRLIFHAPTTVGSTYDPSPNQALHITSINWNPNFHYDPTLYAEVPDDRPDAHLKPGPNSPVGVVWMQLSKEHYGIHGNEDPGSIGYASSHGCVRLTNWDATEVAHRAQKGTLVAFVDTKRGKSE